MAVPSDKRLGPLDARTSVAGEQIRLSRLNAFEGAIVGLAVGDALGYPAEFRRRSDIVGAFGPHGIRGFVSVNDPAWPARPVVIGRLPPGTYTDDTQMSLAVAEALIEAGHKDLNSLMRRMAARFIEWSKSPENNRAPGETTMTACGRLADGIAWRDAGIPESKGCGSAMRVAPIGLFLWLDKPRLLETARASSVFTHRHDAAVEGAAAAALLVGLAMSKTPPEEMYRALMQECAPRSHDFKTCLEKVPEFLGSEPAEVLSHRGLGEGWVAEEAVASALYCFWRSPLDFEQTVVTAANTDGDSDSIACIAGGISGAFNGLGGIPGSWQNDVENSVYLKDVARRLWAAAESASASSHEGR
jgi:ADP-ribosylglycohydrolase